VHCVVGSNFAGMNILVLIVILICLVGFSESLANKDTFMSRIETAQCALQVSVGRIPGTAMPPEWAASGAKLGFNLEVEFCQEDCANYEMTKERLLQGTAVATKSGIKPKILKAVEPLNDPTFVSTKGTQTIVVKEGAYAGELQSPQAQLYGFRFFLDFPEGAVRNDVELPAERIYFLSSCWIQNEGGFQRAQERHDDLQKDLEIVQTKIQSLQEDSQSKGILGKAMNMRELTLLVDKKKETLEQLGEVEQLYPLPEVTQREFVEGPKDLLFAKQGYIAVKRMRGAMETREQYHWVGTFTFSEFFEDLEDEEDEEN